MTALAFEGLPARYLSLQFGIFGFVLSLLWSGPLQAGDIPLEITAPTKNEDGTTLTNLDGYRFYESRIAGGPYTEALSSNDESQLNYILLDRPPGNHYIVATALNADGVESRYSGEAIKTVSAAALVVIDATAYTISVTRDAFRTAPVGTVPLGTPCDPTQQANGLFLVPVASVTLAAGAGATVTFAQCGQP